MRFLLLFLLFTGLSADYIIELRDNPGTYSIDRDLLYIEDRDASLSIGEIEEMDKDFKPLNQDELNFGFTPSVYWFKLPISYFPKDPKHPKQWWLDIDYTLLDDIRIYQKTASGLSLLSQTGDGKRFESRGIQWRTYSTVLDTSSPSFVYIRVQTQSAMQVPITIASSEVMANKKQAETLFYGLFYGVLLLIIFYNIFLFLVWNDKNYLYYVFFIGSFMLWRLCVDGLGYQYIWPQLNWIQDHGVVFFVGLAIFNALLFTRNFLHLKEYSPRLNRLFLILQAFMTAVIVSSFFLSYSFVIQTLLWLLFPIPVVLLFAGIMALKNRYRYARFYIVGWTVFLGASIILAMNKLGMIGGYEQVKYIQQGGSLIEVLFFSLALAERINLMRRQNVRTLSRLNSRLQSEVHEKVSQIREKDELLIQQSRLAAMGEMLENIAHQWKQPLHKLSLVIQNHYFKQKIEGISEADLEKFNRQSSDILEYMSGTIDDFRNFFNPQKEKETFYLHESIDKVINILSPVIEEHNIDITVDKEKEYAVEGYPNEFVQVLLNLFANAKDAFITQGIKEKQINLSIHETQENTVLRFLDNAGGIPLHILPKVFDPYFSTKGFKEGSGIGLYMSKMIIEKSMNGNFNVENSYGGAEFTITLPKML